MTNDMIKGILTFVFAVVIVVAGAAALTYWNRRKKLQSFAAKIVKKEIEMNKLTTQFPRVPMFRLEFLLTDSGKRMKFAVSEKYYSISPENILGTLCIRGTELLSFEGEDFKFDYTA